MDYRALLNKMTTIDQFKGSPQRRPLFFCPVIYLDAGYGSCFGIEAERAVNFHCDSEGTAINYSVLSKAVTSVRNSATCASGALRDDWKKEIEEDYKKRSKKHR